MENMHTDIRVGRVKNYNNFVGYALNVLKVHLDCRHVLSYCFLLVLE